MENLDKIKGGLIVSCQGLENEPMHSSFIMGRFARAAYEGGAVGIRANTTSDIHEIKNNVSLPVIGIIKRDYSDSEIYITPTMKEIDELMAEGVDIIALDATLRDRPKGEKLEEIVKAVREKYKVLLMADISTFEEAQNAEKLGFDLIGTTLRGYTPYTKGINLPDFDFIKKLSSELKTPIVAEGGINYPEELKKVFDNGAFTAVVGGAITRPQNITKRFVNVLKD
jgi:N-acylglucosamine-6-phosphate 2-epimerase